MRKVIKHTLQDLFIMLKEEIQKNADDCAAGSSGDDRLYYERCSEACDGKGFGEYAYYAMRDYIASLQCDQVELHRLEGEN